MRAIRKFSLSLSAVGVLLLLAVALTSVGANSRFSQSSAQKPSATATVARTMKTYTMYSGLWRTDGSFVSTIRIKNVLVVAPLDVTPVLFMADGTPYMLPSVHVPVSGVVTVSVNDALASAPQSVASHVSQFGSVSLIWSYSSPGHVSAQVAAIDASGSLSYTYSFMEPMAMPGHDSKQVLEGLWWKRDSGVTGSVTLSNTTDQQQTATLTAVHTGNSANPRQVPLAPHSTQMLSLAELDANAPVPDNRAGGIRVEYEGFRGAILVNGGLANESEGYSANIPFWFHDMSSAPSTSITYASAGLMIGKPDPMMMPGFPKDTTFSPYIALRNTTEKPLDVALQVNYMTGMGMEGSMPVTKSLPTQHLAPLESKQTDLQGPLTAAGLKNFNGSINLSVSLMGKGGDLVFASGSVDQTGTYVFEVEPQGVASSLSKYSNYWGVANGNDTMFTLWNPTDAAQDIVATFYYGDGSGKHILPVHLEPQASTMIDMAMLIMEMKPDASGNIIPPSVQEGSAQFASAKGNHEKMTVVISAGVFNVTAATCGVSCINCCGDSNFAISPADYICPIGEGVQCIASAVDCSGTTIFPSVSSWSSGNTSVMTVNSSGYAEGVGIGSANISATFAPVTVYTGQMCSPAPYCPQGGGASTNDTVTPAILLGGSNGTDITNTTQNAVVGQQIILYGKDNLPSNNTLTSVSWTIPGTGSTPPTAISNYTYTIGSNSTTGGPITFDLNPDLLSQQTVTYYFVAPASSQVVKFTVNYNDSNGTALTATAQGMFNVAGPTSVSVVTCGGNVSGTCPNGQNALGQVVINQINSNPFLQFGGTTDNIGIQFVVSASQPPGYSSWAFKWVNLISDDNITMTDSNGTQTTSAGTGFDTNGSYPSFAPITPNSTWDNPKLQLISPCFEIKRTFDAKTYLMWNAGLTNPSSIDIPLGSLNWGFSGDAVLNSGTWAINGTPSKYATGFTGSSTYPGWGTGHFNGLGPACP